MHRHAAIRQHALENVMFLESRMANGLPSVSGSKPSIEDENKPPDRLALVSVQTAI